MIKKYDGKQVTTFVSDAILDSVSPQGTMLAFKKIGSIFPKDNTLPPASVLLDPCSNKELIKKDGYCKSIWAEDDSLAGLIDSDKQVMYLYRAADPSKIQDVKLPQGSNNEFIRLTSKGLIAHVVTGSKGDRKLKQVVIPF